MKSDLSAELATLFARGLLRLTQRRGVSPDSGANSRTENPLDLSPEPSGHVVTETPERRP